MKRFNQVENDYLCSQKPYIMNYIRKQLLLAISFATATVINASTSMTVVNDDTTMEAYAVIDQYRHLVFHYDGDKASCTGEVFDLNTGYDEPAWKSKNYTWVYIRPSFASFRPTSTYKWFENSKMQGIDGLKYLNTSEVENMGSMFKSCYLLNNLDVSNFDTSKVKDLSYMFYGCSQLSSLDVSNFDTSKATTLECMFAYCSKLPAIDLFNFTISTAKNTKGLARNCSSMKNIRLPKSPGYCNALDDTAFESLRCHLSPPTWMTDQISGLNNGSTQNVEWKGGIFQIDRDVVTYLVARGAWPTDYYDEDDDCPIYGMTIYRDNYRHFRAFSEKISYYELVFEGPDPIVSFEDASGYSVILGSHWNLSEYLRKRWIEITDEDEPLLANSDKSLSLRKMKPIARERVDGFYRNDIQDSFSLTFDASCANARPTDLSNMLLDAESLEEITGLEYLNTSDVTNMSGMLGNFCHTCGPAILDVSHFNTSKVTDMSYMFREKCNMKSIDLSHFNTSKVTNMSGMFQYCNALESLDLSHFDTSKVTNMSKMFQYCFSLEDLDLSNFTLSEGVNTQYMLEYCKNLTHLVVSASMSDLDETACRGVGTEDNPCMIVAPNDFDFGKGTQGSCFLWKGGYFVNGNPPLIYADDPTLFASSTSMLDIHIDNGDQVVNGFQFDLHLPDGVTLATDGDGRYLYQMSSRCGSGMNVVIRDLGENIYRIMAYSITNNTLSGGDGVALRLAVVVDDTLEANATGRITGATLSGVEGVDFPSAKSTFTVKVSDYALGDANNDGSLNVTDVMLTVNHILGNSSPYFHADHADMNRDEAVNISDVMLIVEEVMNGPATHAPLRFGTWFSESSIQK